MTADAADRPYTHVPDLAASQEVPPHGTLSRSIINDERVKVVLFTFAAGEELSEHTASMPAVLHFLAGRATVTLGADTVSAGPGTWIHMPPHLRHSIRVQEPVILLLTLIKPSPAVAG